MKGRLVALAIVAALAAPAAAQAGTVSLPCSSGGSGFAALSALPQPAAGVCVNGKSWYQFTDFVTSGKMWQLQTTTVDLGRGGSFTLGATFNPDPFVIFSFGSVLPAGFGPVTFDVFFTTPVVGGPYNTAASSGTLGVTAVGAAGTSGTVTAGTYPAYISGWAPYPSNNLGVDIGSGTCTIATLPSPNSTSCNPAPATNTFAPITPPTLTAYLSYTHTTGGTGLSSVAWTGAVDLSATAVPEPATVTLVLGGLLLVGAVARRRRDA